LHLLRTTSDVFDTYTRWSGFKVASQIHAHKIFGERFMYESRQMQFRVTAGDLYVVSRSK
jgi:glutamate mutase epsilon subunit